MNPVVVYYMLNVSRFLQNETFRSRTLASLRNLISAQVLAQLPLTLIDAIIESTISPRLLNGTASPDDWVLSIITDEYAKTLRPVDFGYSFVDRAAADSTPVRPSIVKVDANGEIPIAVFYRPVSPAGGKPIYEDSYIPGDSRSVFIMTPNYFIDKLVEITYQETKVPVLN